MNKKELQEEYEAVKARYEKLSAYIERLNKGDAPIHDDTPVAEVYEQQKVMERHLATLRAQIDECNE